MRFALSSFLTKRSSDKDAGEIHCVHLILNWAQKRTQEKYPTNAFLSRGRQISSHESLILEVYRSSVARTLQSCQDDEQVELLAGLATTTITRLAQRAPKQLSLGHRLICVYVYVLFDMADGRARLPAES